MLELRVGLIRLRRSDARTDRSTPLVRANFGVGDRFEIISELEYSGDEDRMEEGAVGFKWVRFGDALDIGFETLTLLPVQQGQSGPGLESQFLATLRSHGRLLHFNVGAFRDSRGPQSDRGWRSSVLAEFPRERVRPGVEVFARERSTGTAVQLGFGAVSRFRRLELRTGLHFGLTNEAPDVEASVWFSWKWQVAARERRSRVGASLPAGDARTAVAAGR